MKQLKEEYEPTEIGPYIEEVNERNNDEKYEVKDLRGVASSGTFEYSKAKTDGLSFTNYKIVSVNDYAYNPSRINLGSISLNKDQNCIVSPMYIVFRIKDDKLKILMPEFLQIWFARKEFQRSTLFYASGSVRDTFGIVEMSRVKIPIPSPEKQRAIVNIYNCAREAKDIANKTEQLIKDICPALIRQAIGEAS